MAPASRRGSRCGSTGPGRRCTRRSSPTTPGPALAAAFDNVVVHDAGGAFPVLDPAIVVSYLASWPPEALGLRSGPVWDAVLAEMSRLVHAVLIAR